MGYEKTMSLELWGMTDPCQNGGHLLLENSKLEVFISLRHISLKNYTLDRSVANIFSQHQAGVAKMAKGQFANKLEIRPSNYISHQFGTIMDKAILISPEEKHLRSISQSLANDPNFVGL